MGGKLTPLDFFGSNFMMLDHLSKELIHPLTLIK